MEMTVANIPLPLSQYVNGVGQHPFTVSGPHWGLLIPPKQSTRMLHGKRESHGNVAISPNEGDITTSNASVASTDGGNQNVIW